MMEFVWHSASEPPETEGIKIIAARINPIGRYQQSGVIYGIGNYRKGKWYHAELSEKIGAGYTVIYWAHIPRLPE